MSIIDRARVLRDTIEELSVHLDDEIALENSELFPMWSGESVSYTVGQRLRYDGTLYKVLQAHTSQPGWTPDAAPSLFAEVLPGQDGTEVGEWTQPDSTNPYMMGDRVMYNGTMYESMIDNNVWSPADYPQGWQEVTA